uniref:Uncharacterized protein n=1 Tax=Arundo donax TaxID=35708 RepID=A0A0A9EB16_ARUDO
MSLTFTHIHGLQPIFKIVDTEYTVPNGCPKWYTKIIKRYNYRTKITKQLQCTTTDLVSPKRSTDIWNNAKKYQN